MSFTQYISEQIAKVEKTPKIEIAYVDQLDVSNLKNLKIGTCYADFEYYEYNKKTKIIEFSIFPVSHNEDEICSGIHDYINVVADVELDMDIDETPISFNSDTGNITYSNSSPYPVGAISLDIKKTEFVSEGKYENELANSALEMVHNISKKELSKLLLPLVSRLVSIKGNNL